MTDRVCPFWIGYLLLSPLRKVMESPEKLLESFVETGMTVLEPGCAMGFFTLPLARMVGPEGKVIAIDIQPRMLAALSRRARKAGLSERVEIRRASEDGLGIGDLDHSVDFAAAIHVVHEMPDARAFFEQVRQSLKPGGRLLVIEPRGHVSTEKFHRTASVAEEAGFRRDELFSNLKKRKLLLTS
jgi:ubiquinone/menaquinone biosynthesis C-methylase UbiE